MIFNRKPTFDWLVVGLGNPGLQYENTRHNIGFAVMDALLEKCGATLNKNKFEALFGEGEINKNRVLLAKPQTYMNLSGKAVSAICNFYKIPYNRVIVMFDDISLPVGKIRVRPKGTHGGHNGIKDIIELAGTNEICRIKIGVGQKPNPEYDLKDWVLGHFSKEDAEALNLAKEKAVKAVYEIITRGVESAMNRYNG